MKVAWACAFYGNTPPLVGAGQRANIINAAEAGHTIVDDYSVHGTQHRNACEVISYRAARDERIDALFMTEHDVLLPPAALNMLAETLERTPDADMVAGIAFRRGAPYNPMVARLDPSLTVEQYEAFKDAKDANIRRAAQLMSYEEMRDKTLMSISTIDTSAPPFRVDTASLCCVLFRRSVFERTKDVPDLWAVDLNGFFSIDNAFFLRLRDLGMKLYCDPRVLCGHLDDPEIVDVMTWRRYVMGQIEKVEQQKVTKLREQDQVSRIYGELTRLANHHGTDKGTLDHSPDSGWHGWVHGYCDFYETMLDPIRRSARNVIEIGVWHGASLKMWRDYFQGAQITGMDVDPACVKYEGDRIGIVIGDQTKREDLAKLPAGADLIVDDGSHFMDAQQISLGFLFQRLRPGGYYILEDLHTSFLHGTNEGDAYDNFGVAPAGENATIKVIEALAAGQPAASQYMTADELAYLNANVESCLIYGRKSMTCVIRKRA